MTRTRVKTVWAAVLGVGALLLAGPQAHADFGTFQARYIAGTVHMDVGLPADEAIGPVDCGNVLPTQNLGGTAGGACFDLRPFLASPHQFVLSVHDNISAHVSVFAGFDTDGDGCVGCVPGADKAWEGIDFLGGEVSAPGILTVFVRAISNDGAEGPHIATTGEIDGFVFDSQPGQAGPCDGGKGGPEQGHRGCHPFDDPLPYPYPCIPACEP